MKKIEINGVYYTEEDLRRAYRVRSGEDDEGMDLDELVQFMEESTKEQKVTLTSLREMVLSFNSPWEAAKAARTKTTGAYEYLTDVLAMSSMHSIGDWKARMFDACRDVVMNFGLSEE